ncbi:VirD4-like conjugal transfer protein, CD1115 family [Priestia filamentosa]|uniref:VirD4-like conjugal transfer protein, CD1115 family n=1 Tax=Priestia filamentosa TaxID=1402861 RepID=UPI000E7522F1|nr:type IV secretory system conjugative DNA transfer family protein [Priestia filamentosa]RJS62993.1 ATPase [Priestia filamentosa]
MRESTSIKYKIAEKQVLIPLSACFFILTVLGVNFIFNMILDVLKTSFSDVLDPQPFHPSIKDAYTFHFLDYSYVYGAIGLGSTLLTAKLIYNIRSNFKNLNQNQKGSSRFTTEKELQKQYRTVPERGDRYPGGGGIPISRMDKLELVSNWKTYKKVRGIQRLLQAHLLFKRTPFLLIDDSPVNNMIVGITRSGKGETFVFPAIDVYSRAENQPSLINNDTKGELFAASKETLEKRGYHIEVLNLLNPLESMSYNPLQLIIEAYKQEDYSTAQSLCNTLSYTLYYNPNSKDPFWQNCAMSLCNAMILAITDKCIKEGKEEKITMYAVANMLSELGSREIEIDGDSEETQNALDKYFQDLPSDSVAKMQYATSNFSKGTTRGGIFTQTMDRLSIFTFDEIAKMTSRNSVDLKRVGFGKTIRGKATPRKRVEIIFPDKTTESIKTDGEGRFELNFQQTLKVNNEIYIEEREGKKKCKVMIKQIDEDTGETTLKVKEGSEGIEIQDIIYFNKPIAIFMITPDYDSSNHVIASIFVRQMYSVLAKNASLARSGKCHREIVYILDEFGNMPAIEDMSNMVTVCLGRNIRFNLVIQAYSQLKNKYGDNADTISGNCGNTIYILTSDNQTAETISKKLGNETIHSTSRSGKGLSLDKSKTESVDTKPLLTASELMSLEEGENVVYRVIKRQDQERNRVKAYPIFNTGKTAMKYRWEYLGDEFNTDQSILDLDIVSLHEKVDPKKLIVDFSYLFGEKPYASDQEKAASPQPTSSQEKEEETSQASDAPFASSPKDWKSMTINEFFASDPNVLRLIQDKLLPKLPQTIEDLEHKVMEEFLGTLHELGANDQMDSFLYDVITKHIRRIGKGLENEEPQPVQS